MEKNPYLQKASSHGSLAPVHESIQTEFVIGINLLRHDIECPLSRTVHAQIFLGVVDRQLVLPKAGAVSRDVRKSNDSCIILSKLWDRPLTLTGILFRVSAQTLCGEILTGDAKATPLSVLGLCLATYSLQ